jgi:hypothetical protein
MGEIKKLEPKELAIRAHDISVSMENASVPEFDMLSILGMAFRLTLHLRGVPAISYEVVRQVAVHLLDIPSAAVKTILEFLAEAEFIRLVTEGKTIKTIIPEIPFYNDIFDDLGQLAQDGHFNEPELLTLILINRLSQSPIPQDHAYLLGAEKVLVNKIIDIGTQGSFIVSTRARGKDILLSPTYFPENNDAYTDLVAGYGAGKVSKILNLLKNYQGWPLNLIERTKQVGDEPLDDEDILVLKKLAGDGFVPPPAIETTHSGINYFIFGPRPGLGRINPSDRPIYESAMSLVAAVRQGQLLPDQYSIRYPVALLNALKTRGYIRANTEAFEQYKQVAALRVGKLETINPGWDQLTLIDRPENKRAIDLAIEMVSGENSQPKSDDEILLALRKGENYIESLVGRKRIKAEKKIELDEATQLTIDDFLLRGHSGDES